MGIDMSTLLVQYENYLKDNPYSRLTYGEWLKELSVSLMDGLENEPPYASDDFQIGPDGAHEHDKSK